MTKFKDLEGAGKSIADHLKLYLEDPDAGHDYVAGGHKVTTLLLSAKGRKSGKVRTLPLIYKKIGEDHVIVASKGGMPDHPLWYKNLLATPECEVQVKGDRFKAIARTVTSADRAKIWPEMVEAYPPYADYQARTDREIPIVVLERQD